MSKEETQRNKLIYYRMCKQHKTYKQVAQEFGITVTRVHQIIEQEIENNRPENLPINQHIPEIEKVLEANNESVVTRGRIYNALASRGLLKHNEWKHATREELLRIPHIGQKTANLILQAQEID